MGEKGCLELVLVDRRLGIGRRTYRLDEKHGINSLNKWYERRDTTAMTAVSDNILVNRVQIRFIAGGIV